MLIKQRQRLSSQESTWGLIFLTPWLLGFLIFTAIPLLASIGFSLTNYNLLHPEETKWVGLDNYKWLLTNKDVRDSAWVTLKFSIINVPISLLLPLLLAAILTSKWVWGKPLLRTMFFIPTIVPLVSGVLIWSGFLNSTTGWLNRALEVVGITGPQWLNSTLWIYPALLFISMWGVGNAMTTMVAGMQGVPTELFEAARVDGANGWTIFSRITVPMITPVIFYNLVLSVIGAGQYFLIPLVLKGLNGDPAGSTMFFNLFLYRTAFNFSQMGRGAALAWGLFVTALALTGFLFGTAKYWVYYAGGDK